MKKRLRKKKRLGEFQELGFEINFALNKGLDPLERNAILDTFITEAVEGNGLQFGGGGDDHWQGFVALNQSRGSATEFHREAVRRWLEDNSRISNIHIGPLQDAWYGWNEEG